MLYIDPAYGEAVDARPEGPSIITAGSGIAGMGVNRPAIAGSNQQDPKAGKKRWKKPKSA